MSGRNIRHARTGWEWGPNPPRSAMVREEASEQLPPEPPARKAPARKNTRQWCKGKEGREHVPVIVYRPQHPRDHSCEWGSRWTDDGVGWLCRHHEECSVCGKILRDRWKLARAECPAYPGTPEQRAAAEAEAAEARERIAAFRASRKRVITGRQGYRKPKVKA